MPLPAIFKRWLRSCAVSAATGILCLAAFAKTPELQVSRVWQYAHAQTGVAGQTPEIVAYDERTDTLWGAGVVDVRMR
jgi:hypothetical protein